MFYLFYSSHIFESSNVVRASLMFANIDAKRKAAWHDRSSFPD